MYCGEFSEDELKYTCENIINSMLQMRDLRSSRRRRFE